MIFAFVHATLGWMLAGLAAFALRRRSPDARCWAWRFGLLKGPLALLLAVPVAAPIVLTSKAPLLGSSRAELSGSPRQPLAPVRLTKAPLEKMTPAASTMPSTSAPVSDDPVSPQSPASAPSRPSAPRFSGSTSLLVVYLVGLVTALVARIVAARRPRLPMPRVEGFLRPRVVVPDDLDPVGASMARAHEEAHVRRRDPLWSFVAELACVGLWFAPPVWLCARGMRGEAEVACDAAALETTRASRKAYATLLLNHAGPAPANALGGSARRLARRIRMLERTPKPLFPVATIGLLSAGALLFLPWRAVARPLSGPERQRVEPVRSPIGPIPAVRMPLDRAAKFMLEEPGVRAKVGWTMAQDGAVKAGVARWQKVWDAFAAELYARQKSMTLRKAFAWDAQNRDQALARADAAAEPYPWTPGQEKTLKSMALARFGSGVWRNPEIDARLHLTPAQKIAIAREDATIAKIYTAVGMRPPLLRPAKPMPDRVKRQIAALTQRYLDAPAASRQSLNDRISALQSRDQPVYGPWSPKSPRENTARVVQRTWSMRADADRRLEALLSSNQRTALHKLKDDPSAWATPVEVSRASHLTIRDQSASLLPAPRHEGDPAKVVPMRDGSKWKGYRDGTKPPYEYYVDRSPAPAKPQPATSTAPESVPAEPLKPVMPITNVRWYGLTIDGPPPGDEPGNVPIGVARNPDGSTWTVYRARQSAPYTYAIEFERPLPKDGHPQMLRYDGSITTAIRSQYRAFPLPKTLTIDGKVWSIHPQSKPMKGALPTEGNRRAMASPKVGAQPWTEASIRQTLHLHDGESLDFKPDPNAPGQEIATLSDREGIVSAHTVIRKRREGGSFAYTLKTLVFRTQRTFTKP